MIFLLLVLAAVPVLMLAEYLILRHSKQDEIQERLRRHTEMDLNAPFVHDTESENDNGDMS